MGDKTGIQWTDATTEIIDRGGGRVRLYHRKDPSRPGQQERRAKLALGFRWCRGCRDWLQAHSVRQGACRTCLAADERARYEASHAFKEYRKGQRDMRRRAVERMPPDGAELILELFEGECAYCPEPAATWDHAVAVTLGGQTVPGNMLPACLSCNSRKRNLDLGEWLASRAPSPKPFTAEYLSTMGVM